MKVAVSSEGKGKQSNMSQVFGRCPYFVIVDLDGGEEKTLDNMPAMQRGGAGITAAELVGNEGVGAVITKMVGPKAFAVLTELGIKIYEGRQGTVEENLKMFEKGELKEMQGSTGPGFQGMGRGRF